MVFTTKGTKTSKKALGAFHYPGIQRFLRVLFILYKTRDPLLSLSSFVHFVFFVVSHYVSPSLVWTNWTNCRATAL